MKTDDGSYTLQIPEWNEQYHSKHGAIAEALHVFIKNGLYYWLSLNQQSHISIMEIGFGTGLNSILTFLEAQKNSIKIHYTGIEAFPLTLIEAISLQYPSNLEEIYSKLAFSESNIEKIFSSMHQTSWEEEFKISENFHLIKKQKFFSEITEENCFDLIYFDAFGIRVQPELWTEEIFQKMFTSLKPSGILVTYAANGNARRAMQAVGFTVDRIPGPPGKKEMMRATKR